MADNVLVNTTDNVFTSTVDNEWYGMSLSDTLSIVNEINAPSVMDETFTISNALEVGGTISFSNSLNAIISGTISINNKLLEGIGSTLTISNNLYGTGYLDGVLSMLNRIESDDTGIYNDVYVFSKTHGL